VDPTVIYQPAANTGEPSAAEPPARKFANDQVVVGDIPAERPGLQPRFVLLTQLNRTTQRSPVVVLTGTWGVGKTQLAAAYARARLASGWRLIAWVNSRDGESLLAGLAAVAKATGVSDDGSRYGAGAVEAGQAVRSWLETDGSRCLLVFDDAEDPGLLLPFVPAAGAARVLITVAREPTAELGTSIPVDVFSAEEAVALLDGRTGLADEAGTSAVAAELGYLPLALDQAAAVIAGQHLGYAAYLAELQALPVEDYLIRGDGEEQPYPPGVAEAVLLSLQAARAADPVGVCTGVMEFMAMLSPAAVRCDLLRAAGQAGTLLGRGRRVDASMVDQALARLSERSLLDFSLDGQVVSVHGLVARVVHEGLARRGGLATAVRAAASALEVSAEALAKPQDHAAVREMLGQVMALLDNAGTPADNADEELASMLLRLRFLALNARDSLAAAYQAAGRAAEAIPLLEQSLAGRERLLGPDHPDTMRSRNNLARAYREAGRITDAIPLVQQTLAARERLLGPDHASTLASRNNLASAYWAAGRLAEAIPLFESTLAACKRLLGPDDPRTVATRGNLALVRKEAGRAE
jgi:tetratricopeptide (TPR) repeat protein